MKNIKKFEDYIKESILPEPVQMDIEDVPHRYFDSDNISIDYEIENKISNEFKYIIDDFSFVKKYTDDEIKKLNLYFGIYKKPESRDSYLFNIKFGTFGQPITNIKGFIHKKKIIDIPEKNNKYSVDIYKKNREKVKNFLDQNNIEDEYFLIDGIINVKAGDKKGGKSIDLIFKKLEDIFKFLDSFKQK
jgi:hypothetical protein